jgi:hypothetical protein
MIIRRFLPVLALVMSVSTAQAFMDPGTGLDFAVLAQKQINLTNGPITINGAAGVNDVGGLLKLGGINVVINGTAIADFSILNTGSLINGTLETNHQAGGGKATTVKPAPPLPFITPFPSVSTDPCVINAPDLTITSNTTLPSPTCAGQLTIASGVVVTLMAGGTYNFNGVRMLTNSSLVSGGASTDIHVRTLFVTENHVVIDHVNVLASFNGNNRAIDLGKSSQVTGNLEAPDAIIHIHDGNNIMGEVIGLIVTIEPSMITVTPPNNCCPAGETCKP